MSNLQVHWQLRFRLLRFVQLWMLKVSSLACKFARWRATIADLSILECWCATTPTETLLDTSCHAGAAMHEGGDCLYWGSGASVPRQLHHIQRTPREGSPPALHKLLPGDRIPSLAAAQACICSKSHPFFVWYRASFRLSASKNNRCCCRPITLLRGHPLWVSAKTSEF